MLAILLLFLAQVRITDDSLFMVTDPTIIEDNLYFQAATELLTAKETNNLGTLYAYAHSNPEVNLKSTGETVTLELPAYSETMIISATMSQIRRAADNAWLVAVGDKAGYVYIWRFIDLEPEFIGSILITNPNPITALCFSYSVSRIFIGTQVGSTYRYNLPLLPWDDVLSYPRCDGACDDNYLTITESDATPLGNWLHFSFPVQSEIKGVIYTSNLTDGYEAWVYLPGENYNDLYLADDLNGQCEGEGESIDCAAGDVTYIADIENEFPYESTKYLSLEGQSCIAYCLKITTFTSPILELSTTNPDYVRIEQKYLFPGGLWGFNPDRWSQEFSIYNGLPRANSLVWDYGTWTVEWPMGKGFDLNWYKMSLDTLVIEQEGESPIELGERKSGQIGPFRRGDYYKTSDGFNAIIREEDDDPLLYVPGFIDIFDIITKEKPYVTYKRSDVTFVTDDYLGYYVDDLDAIIVYYDDSGTYFLGQYQPDCTTFEIEGEGEFDCIDGFLPASDLRYFEYDGDMPPGIVPDCLEGSVCIDTSSSEINVFQSEESGLWFIFDSSMEITQDHCGILGPGIIEQFNYTGYLFSAENYSTDKYNALQAHLGANITEISDHAMLCGAGNAFGILVFFVLIQDGFSINESGSFVFDTITFNFTQQGENPFKIYRTSHEALADYICIPDACYSGGVDCVNIPTEAHVFSLNETDKDDNTWDNGYNYAISMLSIPEITEDHCFTGGLAYPGRSINGKYVAYLDFATEGEAEDSYDNVEAVLGTHATHSGGGDILLADIQRTATRVYIYTLCTTPYPGPTATVTFATHTFSNFVKDLNAFSTWTYSLPTAVSTICKSPASEVYKLDQTAKEFEEGVIASKVDLLGYDDVKSLVTYEYSDLSIIDIPWGGSFYDIMYISPDPDYEIFQEFSDTHYINTMFSQEGELLREEEIETDYMFRKLDSEEVEGEGEYRVYHYEGEDAYIGGYPPLPGEYADLYVMEGEATEGEIYAKPECEFEGEPWEGEYIIYQNNQDAYFLSTPSSHTSPDPLNEKYCGLSPAFPNNQVDWLTVTLLDKASLYDDYVSALGNTAYGGSAIHLVWVEIVNTDDLLLGLAYVTNPEDAYVPVYNYTASIYFIFNEDILTNNLSNNILDKFRTYAYNFEDYEPEYFGILGPYSTRGADAPDLDAYIATPDARVYPSVISDHYILSSNSDIPALYMGIVGKESNPDFIPPGTTKVKYTIEDFGTLLTPNAYDGLLGRNYADTPGEYYIFAHYKMSGNDLILYFLNFEGIASPQTYFYHTYEFNDLPTEVSATGEFYVHEYTQHINPENVGNSDNLGLPLTTLTYPDEDGHGNIFDIDPKLPYVEGVCGETIYENWDKVYIDYTPANIGDNVNALMSTSSSPFLGEWQQSDEGAYQISHFIAGYDIIGAVLRVYFYVNNEDTASGTDTISIGAPFASKTAADRIPYDGMYIRNYDDVTAADDPEVHYAYVPVPDEAYGWDCISTEGMLHYRNYADTTWIVTSDADVFNDKRWPITYLKNEILIGWTPYSRRYGPYEIPAEFNERYEALINGLGANVYPTGYPVIILHVKKDGGYLVAYYLTQGSKDGIPTYLLDGYPFSMTRLEEDYSFGIIAYDYPELIPNLCKDFYSEKIESTTNFTVTSNHTSSTVDLRGYAGLTQSSFSPTSATLYYNLMSYDASEWETYVPALYSLNSPLIDAYLTDDFYEHEIYSTVSFKDKNLLFVMLTPPLYNVYDAGGTTSTRFDDTVGFITVGTQPSGVVTTMRNNVGKAVVVSWPDGSAPAILSGYAYIVGLASYTNIVMMQEFEDPVPSDLTVLEISSTPTSTLSINQNHIRYFKFDYTGANASIGNGSILRLVGSTTLTGSSTYPISAFYMEDSDTYWGFYHGTTSLPTTVTHVRWFGQTSDEPISNYAAQTYTNIRKYTRDPGGDDDDIVICKELVTPATFTYDELNLTYEDPTLFTKSENIVTYEDMAIDEYGVFLTNSVPEVGYRVYPEEGESAYLRFVPRTRAVSIGEEGESVTSGDLYTSSQNFLAEGELYVNFGITADVSEATPGYKSIYVGEDIHTLERVKGTTPPVTYALQGVCRTGVSYDGTNQAECETAWGEPIAIDLELLYEHTYNQDDYTIYLKNGNLWARASNTYTPTPLEWVKEAVENFEILMEWIEASESITEFFGVYFGIPGYDCQGGVWEDEYDIPDNCNNVVPMTPLQVSEWMNIMEEAINENVVIYEYLIAEDVQKFWVVEDTPHMGLESFMSPSEFYEITDSIAETFEIDKNWFRTAAYEIWYTQEKPVGYEEYYFAEGENYSDAFSYVRITAYLPILKEIIPTNVGLSCLRQELRDWQRPNTDRLGPEANANVSLRVEFINQFLLSSDDDISYASWNLINIMEPVAFQAPRVIYLTGGGTIYANNVWGTMPFMRFITDPHIGEGYTDIIRSVNNNLIIKDAQTLWYGALLSNNALTPSGDMTLSPYGRILSNTIVLNSNQAYFWANLLDPWGLDLYRCTVPSTGGTTYIWPREFMATSNYPWDDPPGYLNVCD